MRSSSGVNMDLITDVEEYKMANVQAFLYTTCDRIANSMAKNAFHQCDLPFCNGFKVVELNKLQNSIIKGG